MKKQTTFLAFAFAAVLAVGVLLVSACGKDEPAGPGLPTDGLVAYYKFDGNAQDESGFSNHGNANNGVQYVRNRKNEEGKSADFDGIDDYIRVPHSGAINFGRDQPFTISLWVKYGNQVNTKVSDNDILSKWAGAVGYPYVVRLHNQTYMGTGSNPGSWHAGRWDGTAGGGAFGGPGRSSIADQQFHHIVFMKKGTLLYGYTDGVETSRSPDGTIGDTQNTVPLYIGAREPQSSAHFYTGAVDDLRIYNRALTADEITALYNE